MPNGLITPGLVLEIGEAVEDAVITPKEFSEIMATVSSTIIGVFSFGLLGLIVLGVTNLLKAEQ